MKWNQRLPLLRANTGDPSADRPVAGGRLATRLALPIWLAAIGIVGTAWTTRAEAAEPYPARPVTLIVPFTPGGGTDLMGRVVAEKLTQRLGKAVVVSNRPGAGGTIGTDLAARAEPDGYTLMIGSVSTISINPSLYGKLATNPLKDLVPVSPVASTPSVLAVANDVPADSVRSLLELARARPGSVNFGSAGQGTSHHLAGELLKMQAKIDATHVPYNGTAPAVMGLTRGDVQILIANMPSLRAAIDGKRIKPLAVTSLQRSPQFPDYPTVAESGLDGFEVIVWYGVFAPAGTPAPIVARLNAEIREIVQMPDVREKLLMEGADPMTASPAEFAERIRSDYEKWARVVRLSNTKLD